MHHFSCTCFVHGIKQKALKDGYGYTHRHLITGKFFLAEIIYIFQVGNKSRNIKHSENIPKRADIFLWAYPTL